MMYYEVDVLVNILLIQKETQYKVQNHLLNRRKQTVSNILDKGKEVATNIFSFGDDDENAPNREDFPMGRSGAKKFRNYIMQPNLLVMLTKYVEPQLDSNSKICDDGSRIWSCNDRSRN